jgi:hypothetical protein
MMARFPTTHLIKTEAIIEEIFGKTLHKKRQQSLAYAAMGVLGSQSLFLHELGAVLSRARGTHKKHATKQIDRLLSNQSLSIWALCAQWVPYVVGHQKKLLVALDWTSFAGDKQYMLSLNVLTAKGVSSPLLWKTVDEKLMKHNRARYEDQLLSRLKEVLPAAVEVTLVADRGFADQKFFRFLDEELKFNYIIRIKSNTLITHKNTSKKAVDWLRKDHRAVNLEDASITLQHYAVKQAVIVQDKEMKSAWILASNTVLKTREIINCYAKRWKIEPYFRDLKDGRFGYGLRQTHIQASARRDRLMLLVALSYMLLLLLGQAGEQLGYDKKLKVNTVKTRTHSLFRQGQFYYEFFPNFTAEEQTNLMQAFEMLLMQHEFWCDFFGNQK